MKTKRKIDQVAEKNYAKLGKKFSLVSKTRITVLQAFILVAFVLGGVGAVFFGFKSNFYSGSEAASRTTTNGGGKKVVYTPPADPNWMYNSVCPGFAVYKEDVVGTKQWKVTDDWCNNNPNTTPPNSQCYYPAGVNQTGNTVYLNYLVSPQAFPNVDFSAYPAQDACKALGGRLPKQAELVCMMENAPSYPGLKTFGYWSATETPAGDAYSTGGMYDKKTASRIVRCVK